MTNTERVQNAIAYDRLLSRNQTARDRISEAGAGTISHETRVHLDEAYVELTKVQAGLHKLIHGLEEG